MRDKLLHKIMKPTDPFKAAIQKHLESVAQKDQLFAETMKKEGKNIDDCITYIMNQVQKSGRQGFTDDEVYGMAVHYYDEDKIEIGKPIKAKVVVNQVVELTEQDKEDAKQKAIQQAIEEAKAKMQKKKTPKKVVETSTSEPQIDLFS